MSGVIWKTQSGETGPEIDRQCINGEVMAAVPIPQPAHLNDWHARRVHVPLSKLEEVPNELTRYGGDRGGRG